ncbi:hypothetical protein NIES4071_80710 [Calothrix sp. NIES-4071]|nr:hypothetical protein NIES4071_80710 [Calothrix sp. NIES-4071]BAZ62341.1 hypothetical protein NIES4105_80640 [Calothrix sp. NIES-4105]
MSATVLDKFWEVVIAAITLNPEAFKAMETLPRGNEAAFLLLLMVGLSNALAQAIVLFINRVSKLRFVLSLLISALLFAFSYVFWICSVWLVSHFLFRADVSFDAVFRTLALATAPLLLSFFVALPYLGVPVQILLSLWNLLAFVRGFSITSSLTLWQVFWCGIIGWFVLQVAQRSIGKPVATFGKWLSNTAAGTYLVTDLRQLEETLQTGLGIKPVREQKRRRRR